MQTHGHVYPFAAIVGQEELKLALLLNVVAPTVGGVLIMGERGTGKTTAVRALAELLPPLWRARECSFNCDPSSDEGELCDDCRARLRAEGRLARERAHVPVVDLPLGATEDRVCGTLNIERAVGEGVRVFEPGLLARANRGFLYIDEVNLLEDHLVDLLLDAAATGRHKVEREGISAAHPSRFVLVGSGNPEEGELRPQLLDRFGLYAEVRTLTNLDERVEIVERGEAFARDPEGFLEKFGREQTRVRRRLVRARARLASVEAPRALVRRVAELCLRLRVDGHRGELTLVRAARALAAYEGRKVVTDADARRVAAMSLRHRLRRDPLEQTSSGSRVEQALDELFGPESQEEHGAGETRGRPVQTSKRDGDGEDEGGRGNYRPRGEVRKKDAEAARKKSGGNFDGELRASGQSNRSAEGQGSKEEGSERLIAPSLDARLPEAVGENVGSQATPRAAHSTQHRRGRGSRSSEAAGGGRYVRAVSRRGVAPRLALDATLRAAAPSQRVRRDASTRHAPEQALRLTADDLRFKQFRRKTGTLFVVAVDTSGSMAVNRINQAKGALAELLRRSYVRRDRVALVSFRGREAALLLPPSRSAARARRILDALPVGGPTPLAAGLLRSLEVARRAARQGAERIVLLVFTDARANVPLEEDAAATREERRRRVRLELEQLGAALQSARVSSVVVDTQHAYISGGEASELANALGGRCVRLTPRDAGQITREVL